MPITEEISAEELAQLFYRYHETLAPEFKCEPEKETSRLWQLAPRQERKLMVATARLVLRELAERELQSETTSGQLTSPAPAALPSRREKPVRQGSHDTLGEEGKECGC